MLSGSAKATIRLISLTSCRTLPGQRVEHEELERLVVQRQAPFLLFVGELAQVVIDQRRDLLPPLAQRRHPQADDVEAVEEVLAEAPFGDERLEVGVGGGDDADVDLDRLRLAEPVDLVRLEEAEELGLQVGADFGDLVEEEGAAGGGADDAVEGLCRRR